MPEIVYELDLLDETLPENYLQLKRRLDAECAKYATDEPTEKLFQ